MQIFIILNSQEHVILNVEPSDRILYLKAKIEELKNISCREQKLTYKGICLDNDNTLEHYSIGEDSALRLNEPPKKIRIFIKTLTGCQLTYDVNSDSTIKDVKDAINRSEELLFDDVKLLFQGKQLQDENKLSDYGIVNNSTIHLALRLKGDKPVIYLYPEHDNFDVNVNVSMKIEDGEITSRYPVIKNDDNGTWKVKANKNGEIIYNSRKHYYLFWECLFNKSFNIDEGFVIEGNQCYQFFEEKLQYLGFKENEANDFITYWCPKMEYSKYVLIKFQGEDYDKRAPLQIEPKPDCIKRIFFTFKLLHEKASIQTQNIDEFKINERKGFFVLEWGGSQI